jgi:DNA-binding GntR family transcriptional regulator
MTAAIEAMFNEDIAARTSLNRKNVNGPTGIAGEIVRAMEQRLILGYYPPGENISFKILADTFGVSRQPVSAAISHLRASGYVEVLPQVGCRVVKASRDEVADFFLILSKIDGAVAGLAAERYEGKEGKVLLQIRPPNDVNALKDVEHRSAYIAYVDNFHDQIWKMARSPLLHGRFYSLRNLSSFYLWQGLPRLAPEAAAHLNKERVEIARAIAARDSPTASALMEAHIRQKPRVVGVTDQD